MKYGKGFTIYRTVWFDGSKGEERAIPILFVPSSTHLGDFSGDGVQLGSMRVYNPRGRSYAFRNDKRYRKNKKRK